MARSRANSSTVSAKGARARIRAFPIQCVILAFFLCKGVILLCSRQVCNPCFQTWRNPKRGKDKTPCREALPESYLEGGFPGSVAVRSPLPLKLADSAGRQNVSAKSQSGFKVKSIAIFQGSA